MVAPIFVESMGKQVIVDYLHESLPRYKVTPLRSRGGKGMAKTVHILLTQTRLRCAMAVAEIRQ